MKRIPFTLQAFVPSDIQSYLEHAGDTGAETDASGTAADTTENSTTAHPLPFAEAHQSVLLAEPVRQLREQASTLVDASLAAALESAALARSAAVGNGIGSGSGAGASSGGAQEHGTLPEAKEVLALLEFIIQAVEAGPLHIAAFSSEARIWISAHICGDTATIGAWQRLLAELRKTATSTLNARVYPLLQQRLDEVLHILALSRASLEIERKIAEIATGTASTFIRLHDANAQAKAVADAAAKSASEPKPESAEAEAFPVPEGESYPTVTEEDARSLSELFLQQFVQIIALGSEAEIRLNLTRCTIEIFATHLEGTPQEWHYLLGALELHIEDNIGPIAAAPLPPYFELLSKARPRLEACGALTRKIELVAASLESQIAEIFPTEADAEEEKEGDGDADKKDGADEESDDSDDASAKASAFPWRDVLSMLLSEILLDATSTSASPAAPCLPWLALHHSSLLHGVTSEKFDAFAELVLAALGDDHGADAEARIALLEKALGQTSAALAFAEEEEAYGATRVNEVVSGAAAHLRQGLEVFDTVADLEDDLAYTLHMAQRIALLYPAECASRTAFRHWFLLLRAPQVGGSVSHWYYARTVVSAVRTQIRQDWSHRSYWQQHPAAGSSGAAGKLLEDLPSIVTDARLAASAAASASVTPTSSADASLKSALAAFPFGITPRCAATQALLHLYPLPFSSLAEASKPSGSGAIPSPLPALKGQQQGAAFQSFTAVLAELAPAAALHSVIWARSEEIAQRVTAKLSNNFAELRPAPVGDSTEGRAAPADPATAFRRDVARLLRRLALALSPEVESRAEFLGAWWNTLVEPGLSPRPHGIFRALSTQLAETLHLLYGSETTRITDPLLRPLLSSLRTDSPAGEHAPTIFAALRATFPLYEDLRRHPLYGWAAPTGGPFPDLAEFYRQNSAAALTFAVSHETEEHRAGSISFLEANFPFLTTVLPRGIAHFEWAGFLSMEITKAWHDLVAVSPAGNTLDRFLASLILGTSALPSITDRLRLIAYLQAYRDFHQQSFAATELRPKSEELADLAIRQLSENSATAALVDTDYLRPAVTAYIGGIADIISTTAGTVARLEIRRLTLEKFLPQSRLPKALLVPLATAIQAQLEHLSVSPSTRAEASLWFADLKSAAGKIAPLQPVARKIFASHHSAGTQPVFSPHPADEGAWLQILSGILALDSIPEAAASSTLHLVVAASLPLTGEITLKDLPAQLLKIETQIHDWQDAPDSPSLAPLFQAFQRTVATFTDWKKITGTLPETITALKDKKTALDQLPEGAPGSQHIANLILLLLRNAAIPSGKSSTTHWYIPLQQRLIAPATSSLLAKLSADDIELLQYAIGKAISPAAGNEVGALSNSLSKAIQAKETWDHAWSLPQDDLRLFALRYILAAQP